MNTNILFLYLYLKDIKFWLVDVVLQFIHYHHYRELQNTQCFMVSVF